MAFQLDTRLPLLTQGVNAGQGVQQGLQIGGMLADLQNARELQPIRKQILEQSAQEGKLLNEQNQQAAAQANQAQLIDNVANAYSSVKSLIDAGKFSEAADQLEANKAVRAQSGATNFEDTDAAIAALRGNNPKEINRIKLIGEQAIKISEARKAQADGERFSPTTTHLTGGISVQTTSTGRKIVTDAGGNVLTGQAAKDAITAAEKEKSQLAVDEVGAKEEAKTNVELDTTANIKEQEKLGETRGQIADKINKAAIQSRSTRPAVVAVRSALENIETGKLAQAKSSLGSFIPGLDVSDEQVMQAQITQFVLDTLAQQSGTKTDFDFKKAEEASASLGKTTEANKAILDILIKNLDRTIEEQNQFKNFKRDGGSAEDFKFVDSESESRLNELRAKYGL